jgi:protein SCO1/2
MAATPAMRRALRLLLAAGALCVALAIALVLWFAIAQPLQVLPRMRELPPFTLIGDDGRPLSPADLRGRPALVSIGAIGCGADCAASEALMRALTARLAVGGQARSVALLTISVDPEHDTPEALRAHGRSTPGRRWLTGRPDELKALVGGELGVYYTETAGGLRIDERVLLIDGDGLLRAAYEGARLDPERVLRDLALLSEEAAASGPLRTAYEASHLFLCYPD